MAEIKYRIDDELHRAATEAAARQGVTLKRFVEEALATAIATHHREREPGDRQRARAQAARRRDRDPVTARPS